jgi:hypothetical protein
LSLHHARKAGVSAKHIVRSPKNEVRFGIRHFLATGASATRRCLAMCASRKKIDPSRAPADAFPPLHQDGKRVGCVYAAGASTTALARSVRASRAIIAQPRRRLRGCRAAAAALRRDKRSGLWPPASVGLVPPAQLTCASRVRMSFRKAL